MSFSDTLSRTDAAYEPYIGLRPFEESERDRFFGRDREINILLDNIRFNRLTLLLAGSGVGKSSLLRAGVMPVLGADPDTELLYHNVWSGEPAKELKQSIVEHFRKKYRLAPFDEQVVRLPLKDMLRTCTMFSTGQQILLFDQFEEFFNYQRFREGFGDFVGELSAAVCDRGLPASFVFSMREDFALELNAFKESLPGVFDNYFRLEKLTREQARLAIEKPLERTDYSFAPLLGERKALLDQVLDDLAKREQERQFGIEELRRNKDLPLLVEPAHLQIVCRELWLHHRDEQTKEISHDAYEKAGGAEGILSNYFLREINLFNENEQKIASAAFDHLIGQRASKITHSLETLSDLTDASVEVLLPVLERLQENAILRRQKKGQEFWYELYHDIFSESIDHWNRDFKAKQRAKQSKEQVKRFAYGVVASLITGGLLFVAYNWRENYLGRYLVLQDGVFDHIETFQGKIEGLDLFAQQRFLYETPFLRQELEADKKFYRSLIDDKENTRANLVGRLPILERLLRYAENGLYNKSNALAENILESKKEDQISSLPAQLASVRTQNSVDLLMQIFNDPELDEASAAVTALARLGDNSSLREFFLKNENEEWWWQVTAETLGKLGDRSVPQELIRLLADKDENADVRQFAAETLGKIGGIINNRSVASELVKFLKDENADVRQAAVQALGKLGDRDTTSKLVELLEDKEASVREAAAQALGELRDRDATSKLVEILEDKEASVREAAAQALGELRDRDATSKLVEILKEKEPEWFVRKAAAQALGKIGDSLVASELVKFLDDENESVRLAVVTALGKLDNRSVASELVKILKNEDEEVVQRSAAEALGKLGDRDTTSKLVELLEDKEAIVRRYSAEALGELGDRSVSVTEKLGKLLEDKEASVRKAAAEALGKLVDRTAAQKLGKLLGDKEASVREAAANSLGKQGERSGVPELVKLLKDEFVRRSAAKDLGELDEPLAVSELIKLLGDINIKVRRPAVEALGKLGDRSVAPALVKHLADESMEVRQAAAEALGRLKAETAAPILRRYLHDAELRDTATKALLRMNGRSSALRDWQEEQFKSAQEQLEIKEKQKAAVALGSVFTEEAVKVLSNLLGDTDQDVVEAAVASLGNIGAYRPGLVQGQVKQLLEKLTDNKDQELRHTVIAALGQLISFQEKKAPATLLALENKVHQNLVDILKEPKKELIIRQAALDALGATGREDCAKEIYELLSALDKENDDSLRYRSLLWLGRMAYTPAQDYIEKELKKLEEDKAIWRNGRDKEEQETDSGQLETEDKSWKREHWEYMLGNALARINPEKCGIELLNHPFYQVRQGAIRALASRIADGATDATLIDEIIKKHQAFDPDDLPSPFPYAAFQSIDLALWNLEYTGKPEDITILQDIINNLKPCQIPGQEGAIEERLEWTIKRLEENPARNGELAAAEK